MIYKCYIMKMKDLNELAGAFSAAGLLERIYGGRGGGGGHFGRNNDNTKLQQRTD